MTLRDPFVRPWPLPKIPLGFLEGPGRRFNSAEALFSYFPIVSEGSPVGLADDELRRVIDAWDGPSFNVHLARAQLSRLRAAGWTYAVAGPMPERVKIGVSASPRHRAAELGGRLCRAWFVGTAAIGLEQTLLAAFSPWRDSGSETVIASPATVIATARRLLGETRQQARTPVSWEGWTTRQRCRWSWPFWEALLAWGLPEEIVRDEKGLAA